MRLQPLPISVIVLTISASACSSTAQKTNQAPESARTISSDPYSIEEVAKRLGTSVSAQVGAGQNIGAMVGIYDRGEIRYLSYGEIRKNSGETPNQTTLFEVGSLTKVFTGLLLAMDVEQKNLTENDPISTFRPEWQNQRTSGITLLELVTHRSGLPKLPCNLKFTDPKNPYADYSEDELIRGLTDYALQETPACALGLYPSEDTRYSNWGFGLLGYLLATHEKLSYPALLGQKITQPLHLENTVCELNDVQKTHIAQGYNLKLEATPLWDRKILYGSGAIRSNAEDLMKFSVAYLHPDRTPFESAIRRSMTAQFQKGNHRMAYAWNVTPVGSIYKDGATGGFSSFIKIYPARDLAVFYLTNTERDLRCFVESVESIPCSINKK